MGTSTNAILFFGFNFHDSDGDLNCKEFNKFECDWEKMYCSKLGINEPDVEYEPNKKLFSKYWDDCRELLKECPIKVDRHCSIDYPIYYVYIEQFISYRGDTIEINLPKITEKEIFQLKQFCKLMGIEYQEPTWNLVSYWG